MRDIPRPRYWEEDSDSSPFVEGGLSHNEAMASNGYLHSNGKWTYNTDLLAPFLERYAAQKNCFFGPNNQKQTFFSTKSPNFSLFRDSFKDFDVENTLTQFRYLSPSLSRNLSFLWGGIIREQARNKTNPHELQFPEKIGFVAKATLPVHQDSAEATTSAMANYVLSGGSFDQYSTGTKSFLSQVELMADAVANDPIHVESTMDMGLSQVARLRSFLGKINDEDEELPDIQKEIDVLSKLPTVGAEFHFNAIHGESNPQFWRRLALLNMSQYHRESSIQFSRTDRGVIEVRMNPSVYPVTIANWNYMRRILPELRDAYFTITLNRPGKAYDFTWMDPEDKKLLGKLRGLSMLNFALHYDKVPLRGEAEEVNFGSGYLGQTVNVENGEYSMDGMWGGDEGQDGQYSLYVGYGDTLPTLAYYLSMALHKPSLLDEHKLSDVGHIKTLELAYTLPKSDRRGIYVTLTNGIQQDDELKLLSSKGDTVLQQLKPFSASS